MNFTKCPDFLHKRWHVWFYIFQRIDVNDRISLIAFNVILAFPIIFLNLFSMITIGKSSQLKKKLCYFVISMQSFIDLSVGVFGIPTFITILALPLLDNDHCVAHTVLVLCLWFLPTLSTVTLTSMSIERYIGVLHPYSYNKVLTKRRILYYVGVWVLTYVGIVALSLNRVRESEIMSATMTLIHFTFIFYAYTKIYVVVRRLDRRQELPADVAQNMSRKRRLFREIKHAKSCFMVVICFATCFLPMGSYFVFFDIENTHNAATLLCWLMTLSNLNSILNSIIFFWTKTLLRNEAKAILNSILSSEQ